MHGGRIPAVMAAAKHRLIEARVSEALTRMGVPIEKHPLEALLGALSEANGNVEYLRGVVNELAGASGRLTDEVTQVVVRMYGEERDRQARFSQMALSAGVAERRQRVSEVQAELLAKLIRDLLDHPALGLGADQRRRGRLLAAELIRAAEDLWTREPMQLASGGQE